MREKRLLLTFLISSILSFPIFCQQIVELDSLKKVANLTTGDSIKARCYLQIAHLNNAKYYQFDSAVIYAQKALDLSDRLNLLRIKQGAYVELICGFVRSSYKKKNIDAGMSFVQPSLELAKKLKDTVSMIETLILKAEGNQILFSLEAAKKDLQQCLKLIGIDTLTQNFSTVCGFYGSIYATELKYDSAVYWSQKYLEISKEINEPTNLPLAYGDVIYDYTNLYEYQKAIKYALEFQDYVAKHKGINKFFLFDSYHAIVMLFIELEDFDSAFETMNKMVKLNIKEHHFYRLWGDFYYKKRDYQQAEQYYLKVLDKSSNLCIQRMLRLLGEIHMSQQNYDKAAYYWTRAKDETCSNKNLTDQVNLKLAGLNNVLRKKYKISDDQLLKEVLKLYQETQNKGNIDFFIEAENLLIELYQRNKNYQKANEIQTSLIEHLKEKHKRTSDIQTTKTHLAFYKKGQAEKDKIQQLELQKAKIIANKTKTERNLYLLLALSAIAFGGWFFYNARKRAILNRQLSFSNQTLKDKNEQIVTQSAQIKTLYETQSRALVSRISINNQRNRDFETMSKLISTINIASQPPTIKNMLQQIKSKINENIRLNDTWEEFRQHFEQIHPSFFDALKQLHPKLTEKDLRHCAYLRMNLTLRETADILGVSQKAVEKARYRMKQKMNLTSNDNLTNYILNVHTSVTMAV